MLTKQEAIIHINNLIRLAKFHKSLCQCSNCQISIFKVGELARFVADNVAIADKENMRLLVDSFGWK